jgi:hypothetical protein
MKRIILSLIVLPLAFLSQAQEPADALRISWNVPSGTARYMAIGGAMGSLGGDITATYVNPAGLGFYKTGDGVFTAAYHFGKTKANYLGRKESDKAGKFDLGTTGYVFGIGGNSVKRNSYALSIAFNTTASFRNDILYRGLNNQNSYSQKFIEELNNSGVKDSTIASSFYFGPSLAFNTYWIDPVKNSSGQLTGFTTNSPIATGLIQEQKISSRGGIYETAIGFASNHNDRIMIGGSIGIPFVYLNRTSTFTEADATVDTSNRFDYASFSDELTTTGVGMNLKMGFIYKPVEYWRLGFAFHTPTVYSLTDSYTAEVTTNTENYHGIYTDFSKDYTNGGASEFKYVHFSPYKLIGSVSYVLREIQDITKQKGFITADAEYINYKASSYSVDNDPENPDMNTAANKAYLKELNKAIDKAYKGAFNFRLGGELKFTTLMVRAGATYYGNPYKEVNGGKGKKINLSGGLGYRNKGMFIDLTYVHSMVDDIHAPYRLQTSSYPVAKLKNTTGNVLMTLGYKF